MNKNRFWCSWEQDSEDYRPLSYPPNKGVIGWWCSGYGGENAETPILCALIEAKDEEAAESVVKKDWPEYKKWRFIETAEKDWKPSDRFPLSDWMKARI